MNSLERQAVREILADVRREMEAVFGQGQAASQMDEERLAGVVHGVPTRWQRARVNANLALVSDLAGVEDEVMNWLVRMGPLEPLIRNPDYEEIFVDGPREVGVIERSGRTVMRPDIYFEDDEEVLELAKRALGRVNRRIDESSPMVDARLKDGSRLNVVIPPVSDKHTVLTIRTFRPDINTLDGLVEVGTITPDMLVLLRAAVHAYLNIVVSGPTGSGKTTMLNALGNETDGTGRMIVIEQTRELMPPELVPLCIGLEAQEPNSEGVGEILQRDLVRNVLRMRPRRIIVGETRGPETWDLLRAMNTGHGGCISSVHANSSRDALDALITLGMTAPERPPETVMTRLIARAISIVIQMAEEPGTGRRLVTNIFELTGLEGSTILGHDLWVRDEASPARVDWHSAQLHGHVCQATSALRGAISLERNRCVILLVLVGLFAAGVWWTHEAWTTPIAALIEPARPGRHVEEFLHQAGLHDVTPRDFLLFSLGAGVVFGAGSQLVMGWPLVSLVAALLGACLPYLLYATQQETRRARVQAELADAMSLLRDNVRAGGDVSQGMSALGEYGPPLLRREFLRVVQLMAHGSTLRAALISMRERLADSVFDTCVATVLLNEHLGSAQLGPVLDELAEAVRQELRVKAELRSRQVQMVWSARVIAVLPLVVLAAIRTISPQYLDIFDSAKGQVVLAGCALSVVVGYLGMRWAARLPVEQRVLIS